jgi:hypothetical protein
MLGSGTVSIHSWREDCRIVSFDLLEFFFSGFFILGLQRTCLVFLRLRILIMQSITAAPGHQGPWTCPASASWQVCFGNFDFILISLLDNYSSWLEYFDGDSSWMEFFFDFNSSWSEFFECYEFLLNGILFDYNSSWSEFLNVMNSSWMEFLDFSSSWSELFLWL